MSRFEFFKKILTQLNEMQTALNNLRLTLKKEIQNEESFTKIIREVYPHAHQLFIILGDNRVVDNTPLIKTKQFRRIEAVTQTRANYYGTHRETFIAFTLIWAFVENGKA